MNEFSKLIRELRGKESIRSASGRAGMSHNYLRVLEMGIDPQTKERVNPSHETIRKLAKAYNYPYTDLLDKAGFFDGVSDEKQEQIKNRYAIHDVMNNAINDLLNDMTNETGLFHAEFKNGLSKIIDDAEGFDDKVDFDTYYTTEKIQSIISDFDSTEWKSETLHELKRMIQNFKEKTDINVILLRPHITYRGHHLTDQDKQLITVYLDTLFRDRISSEK